MEAPPRKKRRKPPHTKEVGFYYFDELDDQAKEKAREWWRQCENECFDAHEFTEMLKEQARYHYAIEAEECYWSLGYCQGDGVAFYGRLDLDTLCQPPESDKWNPEGKLKADRNAIVAGIKHLEAVGFDCSCRIGGSSGNCHHWNSMSVEFSAEVGPEYDYRFDVAEDFFAAGEEADAMRDELLEACACNGCRDKVEAPILVYFDWLEENGVDVEKLRITFTPPEKWEAIIEQVQQDLEQYMKDVSRDIERIGYAELDYQMADEQVDDSIRINEYEFDENGERI